MNQPNAVADAMRLLVDHVAYDGGAAKALGLIIDELTEAEKRHTALARVTVNLAADRGYLLALSEKWGDSDDPEKVAVNQHLNTDMKRFEPPSDGFIMGHSFALGMVSGLADTWARQATDYDEDTEQQIADGKHILKVINQGMGREPLT